MRDRCEGVSVVMLGVMVLEDGIVVLLNDDEGV